MRNRVNGLFAVLTLMFTVFMWSGCSKQSQPPGKDVGKAQSQPAARDVGTEQSQPSGKDIANKQLAASDEDIIRAIDDSGIMKRGDGSFTVVPPVKVVEKGGRNKDGAWPVKVRFTLKYKMKDGRISQPTETTSLFSISEAKDSAGKSVWKARLGS